MRSPTKPRASLGQPEPRSDANLFHLDGEYWTIAYDGRTVRVKDVKGLRDIARLVTDRGTRVHVTELVGASEGTPASASRSDDYGSESGRDVERFRTAVTMRIRFAVAKIERVHPTLGGHLRSAIQTGTSCVYLPSDPIRWKI
jgi:hypothetical protein